MSKIALVKIIDTDTLETTELSGYVTHQEDGRVTIGEGEPPPDAPGLAEIAGAVRGYYGLPPGSLKERSKTYSMRGPRQVFVWLAREFTEASYPEIGRYIHRDHSTVMAAYKAMDHDLKQGVLTKIVAVESIAKELNAELIPPLSKRQNHDV